MRGHNDDRGPHIRRLRAGASSGALAVDVAREPATETDDPPGPRQPVDVGVVCRSSRSGDGRHWPQIAPVLSIRRYVYNNKVRGPLVRRVTQAIHFKSARSIQSYHLLGGYVRCISCSQVRLTCTGVLRYSLLRRVLCRSAWVTAAAETAVEEAKNYHDTVLITPIREECVPTSPAVL